PQPALERFQDTRPGLAPDGDHEGEAESLPVAPVEVGEAGEVLGGEAVEPRAGLLGGGGAAGGQTGAPVRGGAAQGRRGRRPGGREPGSPGRGGGRGPRGTGGRRRPPPPPRGRTRRPPPARRRRPPGWSGSGRPGPRPRWWLPLPGAALHPVGPVGP